jgi:hypothetical protein
MKEVGSREAGAPRASFRTFRVLFFYVKPYYANSEKDIKTNKRPFSMPRGKEKERPDRSKRKCRIPSKY